MATVGIEIEEKITEEEAPMIDVKFDNEIIDCIGEKKKKKTEE